MTQQNTLFHLSADISNIEFNIFDKEHDNQSYSIGDLLNMPHFFANWASNPHANYQKHDGIDMYSLYKERAALFQDSILNIYDKTRIDQEEPIPNIQRIKDSVDTYIEQNQDSENLKKLFELCSNEKTLVVHLRSGDKYKVEPWLIKEDVYMQKIRDLSTKYDTVLVLCGIHNSGITDTTEASNIMKSSLQNLYSSLSGYYSNIYVDISYPDVHLSVMRKAENLIVHVGGFSVLGSIIFTGKNLYITDLYYPISYAKQYNIGNNGILDIIPAHHRI